VNHIQKKKKGEFLYQASACVSQIRILKQI